jgi:hypothetical protein
MTFQSYFLQVLNMSLIKNIVNMRRLHVTQQRRFAYTKRAFISCGFPRSHATHLAMQSFTSAPCCRFHAATFRLDLAPRQTEHRTMQATNSSCCFQTNADVFTAAANFPLLHDSRPPLRWSDWHSVDTRLRALAQSSTLKKQSVVAPFFIFFFSLY